MTIAEKLESIKASKEAIKQAIEAKGVACGDALSEYPEKIAAIPTGGVDMTYVSNFRNWKFTNEQFDALNTYNWDKVTNMDSMFFYSLLTTIPSIDTSNVTNMNQAFYGCSNLVNISLLNTSKVTTMESTFGNCTKLSDIEIDISNVTDIHTIFSSCSNLVDISLLNTSKVNNIAGAFSYCSKLTTIPSIDTSNVTNMQTTFGSCSNLVEIPLLNTSKVNNILNAFFYCSKLTNLGGFQNLSVSLDLHYSTRLTVESLMNVINNLKDLTGGMSQTLTLGATNLAKLTDEQKAVATNKNWVLA